MSDTRDALDLLCDLAQMELERGSMDASALAWRARDAHVAEVQTLRIEIQALRSECASLMREQAEDRRWIEEMIGDGRA